MPAYKNQHFVPRCLLRQFAPGENGRSLNVYNIRHNRLIPNAPLKNQSSRNYMYGKDAVLEGMLSRLEGTFSDIVRRVASENGETDGDLDFLRFFMYLQYRRTEMAVKRLKHAYDAMHANVFGEDVPDPAPPSDYDLMIQSLQLCMETREYIEDLKVRIIQNESDTDFVISDDPAIFANKYAVQKLGNPGFGVSSSGVFFLMPLSPKLCLFCYDGQVYTVPELVKNRVVIKRSEDLDTINELQCLKAAENIYFSKWEHGEGVRKGFERVSGGRREDWSEITVMVPDEAGTAVLRQKGSKPERYRKGTREEGKAAGSALLQLSFNQPVPSRWLRQLKYRSSPKTHYNGSAVGHVRKAEWLKAQKST